MNALQELQGLLKLRVMQLFALALLFVGIGAEGLTTKYIVLDPDIWWHLSVGNWILQNHAVPHFGIFSRTAAERPWVAYSWGYDALYSLSYSLFGLFGIGVFGLLLMMAVSIAIFWSVRRLSENFWLAWILTITACTGFLFSILPRPAFFSMALLTITLTLLLEAQNSGRIRPLYWLPLLFCVWANLHIQFVYGLFVLGLFVAVHSFQCLFEPFLRRLEFLLGPPSLSLKALWAIVAGCVLAACVGPYSFHLYQVVFDYSKAKVTYSIILELLPLSFVSVAHFVELFLAAVAFFSIGWQRKIDLFKVALLAAACIFAFRTTRDAWFLCVISAAFIADSFRRERGEDKDQRYGFGEMAGVVGAIVFCLFLTAKNTDFTSRELDRMVSRVNPVDAANFLRRNPFPGPMFNSFDWGGFLIWYLPQYPVSIDGRNDLYGDELDSRLYHVESGERAYADEPHFTESRLIFLQNDVPLAKLLSVDPAFRTVYRDKMAVIYVRQ